MEPKSSPPTVQLEYRISWSASSNISFRGSTDWNPWGGFEETAEEVEDALYRSDGRPMALPVGLEEALEQSGFDWWVEVRKACPTD